MKTERLYIRKFSPEDWRDLYEYLSQEEVVKFEPYDVFTEEKSKEEAVKRSKNPDFWAVCLLDTGKLIGNIYLSKQDSYMWELGYVFNKTYHGHGYATEAARALLEHIFEHPNTHRVVAMCDPLNTPSWKLMERLGMRREGHYIKNHWMNQDKDGNPIWQDAFEYAILREEWLARR